MKLQVLTIGRARKGPSLALWEDYAARIDKIGPGLGFRAFNLREFPESSQSRASDRMTDEARTLADAARGSSILVLDERGQDMKSLDFADLLANWRDDGTDLASFVIGGADGLDASIRKSAIKRIRFGQQTWPHLLVRAMLAEQIYRAMTIMAGHPYHRE